MESIEKTVTLARCTNFGCRFDGIVLIPRGIPKEESLKNKECPVCQNIGCLQ